MDSKERQNTGRAVTTSEIARLCGVSRTTVSAVLNGRRNVREGTRRKVLDCVRKENYDSGIVAKALVGELSQMVAVLAPGFGSPFQMMMFHGIIQVLDAHGYHALFHYVRPEDQSDPQTLASLHAYRPAGYIILKGAEGPGSRHARRIAANGFPLVTHGMLEGIETHSVCFDNRTGMKLAADYVLAKGHRRLGHLAGPTFSLGAKQRKLGFIEGLVDHGIPMNESVIVDAGETAGAGYEAALEVLENPDKRPTALLCFNDMVAMGVYRAAKELALAIPQDLSVVGFDGIDVAELLGPPLTTVDISPRILGERSAELLMKLIRGEVGGETVTEWVSPKLLERTSVRSLDDASLARHEESRNLMAAAAKG